MFRESNHKLESCETRDTGCDIHNMGYEIIVREMILGTVGRVGLLLFSMGLMSDGVKKVCGQDPKTLLN